MTDTERQFAALVDAAKDNPGRLVEGYGPADRDHLRKAADKARKEAARLDAAANTIGEPS